MAQYIKHGLRLSTLAAAMALAGCGGGGSSDTSAPKPVQCTSVQYVDGGVCKNKATQTITGLTLPALSVGDKATLTAKASSGLPVAYSSQTPTICTVLGAELTAIKVGECRVAVNQAGDTKTLAAKEVTAKTSIQQKKCTSPEVLDSSGSVCVLPAISEVQPMPETFALREDDQKNLVKVVTADPLNPEVTNPKTSVLMQINSPSSSLQSTPVGTVLIFGQDQNMPDGFIGRITEKRQVGQIMTLGFELVQLDEAFQDLKIDLSGAEFEDPTFMPVQGLSGAPTPVNPLAKSGTSKRVSIEPKHSFDPATQTVEAGIELKGAIVRRADKTYDFVDKCSNVVDKSVSCLTATIPFSIKLEQIDFTNTLGFELEKGRIKDGQFEVRTNISATTGITLDTDDGMAKGKKFSFSGANLIKALIGGNSKKTSNGELAFSVPAKGVGRAEVVVKGVEWPETRQAIGSFVFKTKNVLAGVFVPTFDGGSRDVGLEPSIYATLYVDSEFKLHGEVGASVTTPVYQAKSGFVVRNGEMTGTGSFNKIKDTSYSLTAKGGAEASVGLGTAFGIGLSGIVPFDLTAEVGTKAAIDGQIGIQDGKFSGCHTSLDWTYGVRSFFQAALDIDAKFVAKSGSSTQLVDVNKNTRIGLINDTDNWNTTFPVILFKTEMSLGEDTCHQPKITAANWQGGDFLNQAYSFEFDARATRYQPLIKYMIWDYGDGTTEKCAGVDLDACYVRRHQYKTLGRKTVSLKVVYSDESVEIFSYKNGYAVNPFLPDEPTHEATWTVDIKQPKATITSYPASGLAGFVDICKTCVEGLKSYQVDWGDGTTERFDATGQDVKHRHVYSSEGDKRITITIQDQFNNTFQEVRSITVRQSILSIVGDRIQEVGKTVVLKVEGAFSDVVDVVWSFGQGIADVIASIGSGLGKVFEVMGEYTVTATTRDKLGNEVGSTQTTLTITEAKQITGVAPSEVVRTSTTQLTLSGERLPTDMRIEAPEGTICSAPLDVKTSSFNLLCEFNNVGQQSLVVYNSQNNQVIGRATVNVKSNVTAVKWGINNGTVRFGDTITYTVEGVNLTSGMGFAVERCGVSNTEVGTGTDTQRTFQCWFNPEDGAFAGQMAGVVKDKPDGQVLFNFTVPVEVAPATGGGVLTATGITLCGNESTNGLPCTPEALGALYGLGQDGEVQAGQKMSYTVLNRSGAECVQDNVTGLIWEQKTDDNGLRDKDWVYTWYNPNSATNGGSAGTANGGSCFNKAGGAQCDTAGYVAALNAANYCGYSDWRMPTRMELVGLVDYSRVNPSITPVFVNTQNSWYWSASPSAASANYAWLVNFVNGGYTNNSYKDVSFHVRAVRASHEQR